MAKRKMMIILEIKMKEEGYMTSIREKEIPIRKAIIMTGIMMEISIMINIRIQFTFKANKIVNTMTMMLNLEADNMVKMIL